MSRQTSLSLFMLVALLVFISCKSGDQFCHSSFLLSGHYLSVGQCGDFLASGVSSGKECYVRFEKCDIRIIEDELFINDKFYGKLPIGSTILVSAQKVWVDEVEREGRSPNRDQKEKLNPLREFCTKLGEIHVIVKFRNPTRTMLCEPLFGEEYLQVGKDRYRVAHDVLTRNGVDLLPILHGTAISIDATKSPAHVDLLKAGTTPK